MTKLNKGAIPILTQEIFYKCHPNGSVKLNRELTLKEFDKKLVELINNKESK
jgi:hypothetical protein|tara:strand:+ start:279 stop:434 length:156 start_codon:yes stop_codon:yes gene_type:complete